MLYWWIMIFYDCHGVPVCRALSYLDADNTEVLRPPSSKEFLPSRWFDLSLSGFRGCY